MPVLFRWILRGISALVVLLALGTWLVYWLAARSLPDYNAGHDVAGIAAPVEIARDNANVPHIFAASDEDVFFGLGFAHAQDRLFQMELMRRAVQGRLSEVFGERTLASDELMRRLALYEAARASVDDQSPQARAALESYARGVNAWIGEINEGAKGRGAPEFFLFPAQITYWRPADSLALLKLVAFQLSDQATSEVLRARTSLVLPDARLKDILPDAPGTVGGLLTEYAALFPEMTRENAHYDAAPAQDPQFAFLNPPRAPLGGASNTWAAATGRAATGTTLLANDPHLNLSAPGAWYLARLELASGGVIGATVPGIPAVVAGRSEHFGWGVTAAYVDDADLFVEQLNPQNRSEVLSTNGTYVPLRSAPSIVQVAEAAPVTLELLWSENGPILPADAYSAKSVTPPDHVMSLSWTALSHDDTSFTAAFDLMGARTVAEGISAGEKMVAPALNVALASRTQVALKVMGAAPLRDVAHQSQGRIPSPGWIAQNRWQGLRPYAQLPRFDGGATGIVGSTNNKTTDAPFPDHLSYHWGDTQRVERWRRLMQSREVHTRESFIEAQNDIVSYSARALLPLVGAELWFTGQAASEGTPERKRQRALIMLAEWNGEMSEHLPEPLLYNAWMRELQNRLIRDDLGPLARAFTHVEPLFIERVFRDIDGASVWCDVIQSAALESCTDIARLALDDALTWVDENYGSAYESLRWGDAHVAEHDHAILGQVPFIKWIVNIRQSTSGGDNTLMRGVTKGAGSTPFANVHGAAYRGVYDFADPDSSVFVIATGQSGHPLSRHYDDLGVLWRRGEYVPMSLDPQLARAAGVGVTMLTPDIAQ